MNHTVKNHNVHYRHDVNQKISTDLLSMAALPRLPGVHSSPCHDLHDGVRLTHIHHSLHGADQMTDLHHSPPGRDRGHHLHYYLRVGDLFESLCHHCHGAALSCDCPHNCLVADCDLPALLGHHCDHAHLAHPHNCPG